MVKAKIDKGFLLISILLITVGFLIFNSASLGLLTKGGEKYSNVAFSQTFLGLFSGIIAMILTSKINYKVSRKYAFYIFLISIILTLLVFTPLGFEHQGARRWINIGDFSFQPSEALKIAFVIYLCALISKAKDRIKDAKFGLVPVIILLGLVGLILLKQPDTDTLAIMMLAAIGIFIAAGGKWKHIFLVGFVASVCLLTVIAVRPYAKERIVTFFRPNENTLSSAYQINQSLIAVGSGGLVGRGFGQSIQKFDFLPEPIGDSIFAVAAEEFGFIGATVLIFLYVIFAMKALKIALRTPDSYGRLLVVGIAILIVSQAFVNIASMLAVLPLTGIPLPFVSHGGTALLITLAEVGIILNISRYQTKSYQK